MFYNKEIRNAEVLSFPLQKHTRIKEKVKTLISDDAQNKNKAGTDTGQLLDIYIKTKFGIINKYLILIIIVLLTFHPPKQAIRYIDQLKNNP